MSVKSKKQRKQERNEENKRKYDRANQVLNVLFLCLLLASWAGGEDNAFFSTHEILFLALLVLFTIVSGYIAYLNWKLPKKDKAEARWFSMSCFGIHPYVTFLIFLIFTVLQFLLCL